MAITTPAAVQLVPAHQLLVPQVEQEPLLTALEMLNYLWKYHRPAMVAACYTATPQLTRSTTYVIPILPSADGLLYTLMHGFVCSAAGTTVTVTVEYTTNYTGVGAAWIGIYSDAVVTSGSAGGLTTHTKADQTIPATARALRIQYAAPAAGNRTDHFLLVYPTPGNAVAGIQPSGAIPFDDGLLVHADRGAVHTEWLNRLKETSVALLQDRKQCGLSFVQEAPAAATKHYRNNYTEWFPYPAGRLWLPLQGPTATLAIRALLTVTAGATAGLLRVRQIGVPNAEAVLLNATGLIVEGELVVQVQGKGLTSYVDLELSVLSTSGNTTYPHAVMAWPERGWNGADLDAAIADEATPPALLATLKEAIGWVEAVATMPYAGCAHIFDGLLTTAAEARHLAAVIAPRAVHAQAAIARSWGSLSGGSAPAYHETWSSDGGSTGNDVIRVPWATSPIGTLPTVSWNGGTADIVVTSGKADDSPTTPTNRAFELQTLDVPYVEPLYVSKCAGFSLCVSERDV